MNTIARSRTSGPSAREITSRQAFNRLQFGRGGYVRNGRQLLTRSEEIRLCNIVQGKATGNRDAALAELVERNQGLIHKMALKYCVDAYFPYEDAITAAAIGFLTACDKFDVSRNCKLATVATHWICQSLIRSREHHAHLIHIPSHAIEEHRLFKNKWNSLSQELGRDPTNVEVEERMNLSSERVSQLVNLPFTMLSIDCKVGGFGDEGPTDYLVDLLVEPVPSLDSDLFCSNFDLKAVAEGAMALVPGEKSKDVLRRRFGMDPYDDPQTLQEIGDALNLSREGVRQIMVRAIKRIRVGLGLPAIIEVDATETKEEKRERKKRPTDVSALLERNENILRDVERGMSHWDVGAKYSLGVSRVKQVCQAARRHRNVER